MREPPMKPALQKPPGYRDPSAPGKPVARPPPRKPTLPPSFRTKRKRRSCCRTCCCFLCFFIVILTIIVLVVGGVSYLWFSPKIPTFHLQSYRIPEFKVTVKTDATYLDARTVIRIEVKNPNTKLKVYYGRTQINAIVGKGESETELGQSEVAGFTQGIKNVTSLKIESSTKNRLIDDKDGRKLKSGYKTKNLEVRVKARTSLGYVVGRWRIGALRVTVSCGGMTFKSLDGGGEMPKCTVNFLRWINIH
ncbi:NDR1/HIN1-like protein 6 [Ziziphus jujuba]|uniref:NDR1/HIN1-like protein 6 n=1 Tax=Ziziphus jujuba TaxID=326968 RepID=A0A6P4ARK6_ZIZJJ|nr:NDR1/HIN1-like protein 6 [Ziziphus jujuba]